MDLRDFTIVRMLRFARLTKLVRIFKLKAFKELPAVSEVARRLRFGGGAAVPPAMSTVARRSPLGAVPVGCVRKGTPAP